MASLRSRRSAAQLHALVGVEREIRANDHNNRRKYLRDFSEAFRAYDSVLDPTQLQETIRAADIVLIGDYHALPASQAFAASLLVQRAQLPDRPVVLGLETIFSRDQHIVDEWLRREIDEQELRQRIRFDLDWGYDWSPFYQLREFTAWTACRAKTCARSGRAIATRLTKLQNCGRRIPTRSSWCCSESRTLRPRIFPRWFGNAWKKIAC